MPAVQTQSPLAAPSKPARLPRILITGFSAFPGAPINPTEQLIPLINKDRDGGKYEVYGAGEVVTEVLPVEYRLVPLLLEELCRRQSGQIHRPGEPGVVRGRGAGREEGVHTQGEGKGAAGSGSDVSHGSRGLAESAEGKEGNKGDMEPEVESEDQTQSDRCGFDIAIHLGLHGSSSAVTLEHLALNTIRPSPDASGYTPPDRYIQSPSERTGHYPSTLPLPQIAQKLDEKAIPYTSSRDAGGYLCNYIFYLSRAGIVKGFKPGISGFVHVPHAREGLGLGEMREVVRVVVEESCKQWAKEQGNAHR